MNSSDKNKTTYQTFKSLVNLSADELQAWLNTTESKAVGIQKGTTHQKITDPKTQESIGHESGRIIVELLQMQPGEYDEFAYAHMRKVIGYIRRHSAQRPAKQKIETSRWRYSLMNWGHDPLKDQPKAS